MVRRIAQPVLAFLVTSALPVMIVAQTKLPDKIVPCNGLDCTVCHLATLAQNLINTGIFVAVFLAAILFAYAGWNYMTKETVGELHDAKSLFLNVLFGLTIILGAWLFVDTIMKTLMGTGNYLPWNKICN